MNVLILGLGQYPKGSGVMAALHFAKRGDDVLVADPYYTQAMKANVDRLKKYKHVSFLLGKRATSKVAWADLVVRHQRLRDDEPELQRARQLGKTIETELSIFLKACPAQVIGITGTRGKSTTTALVYEMLKTDRRRKVWSGGNNLLSPLDFLSKIKPRDIVVLEMSSFQLEGTGMAGVSPHSAVWTNLMRDHLNAYPNMEAYAEAKAQIFRQQKPEDIVFLPKDSFFTSYARSAPGSVYRFGRPNSREAIVVKSVRLKLLGEHNKKNAEIAVAVALHVGIPLASIKRVLKSFRGLSDRLETIATYRGVRFINDTTATTPDATIAALRAIRSTPDMHRATVHLIFGGADKELAFEEAARVLSRDHAVLIYLLPGTAHTKIVQAFHSKKITLVESATLALAVQEARSRAKTGDIVLLSPGCASFGLFKNEYDRGEQFRRLLKK